MLHAILIITYTFINLVINKKQDEHHFQQYFNVYFLSLCTNIEPSTRC